MRLYTGKVVDYRELVVSDPSYLDLGILLEQTRRKLMREIRILPAEEERPGWIRCNPHQFVPIDRPVMVIRVC